MQDFTSSLEKLADVLNDINSAVPAINRGGCGVFAALLGEKLEELGYEPQYLFVSRQVNDINRVILQDEFQKNPDISMEHLTHIATFHEHVLTKVGNKYIDSNGIFDTIHEATLNLISGQFEVALIVDLYTLNRFTDERDCWNWTFNRDFTSVIQDKLSKIIDIIPMNNK